MRPYQKVPDIDWRKGLDVKYSQVEKTVTTAKFNPEHLMTDNEIDKLMEKMYGPGPTSFDPKHKLTERRADVGIKTFKKENEVKEKLMEKNK